MSEHTVLTDEMSEFLEELRDGGSINMMGAGPHLERHFSLSRQKASTALMEWIGSFDD